MWGEVSPPARFPPAAGDKPGGGHPSRRGRWMHARGAPPPFFFPAVQRRFLGLGGGPTPCPQTGAPRGKRCGAGGSPPPRGATCTARRPPGRTCSTAREGSPHPPCLTPSRVLSSPERQLPPLRMAPCPLFPFCGPGYHTRPCAGHTLCPPPFLLPLPRPVAPWGPPAAPPPMMRHSFRPRWAAAIHYPPPVGLGDGDIWRCQLGRVLQF